jgi:hypothetical protein
MGQVAHGWIRLMFQNSKYRSQRRRDAKHKYRCLLFCHIFLHAKVCRMGSLTGTSTLAAYQS